MRDPSATRWRLEVSARRGAVLTLLAEFLLCDVGEMHLVRPGSGAQYASPRPKIRNRRIIIDNNGNTVGEVVEALSLNGLSTGSNGLLLIGDGYDRVPLGGPWAGFKAAATTVGDPCGTGIYSSLGADNLTPDGGLTFLLVTGRTGLRNATLTSLGTVDVDGNELLDWSQSPVPAGGQTTQPWTAIVDRIGFQDLTSGRFPYVASTADLSRRNGGSSPPQAPNFPPESPGGQGLLVRLF